MRGKLIVIEGTDCSGKETQSKLLAKRLTSMGMETKIIGFPIYNSPTGKIIGSCYLGKEEMCRDYLGGVNGWFDEGASNVDGLVASLYYAADRKYNINIINEMLDNGINVILDRYIYSNMAHQACKEKDMYKRIKIIRKLESLEFDILELPKPDMTFLLYVPVDVAQELKKTRLEKTDQHEADVNYLRRAEDTYLMLSEMYKFNLIECTTNNNIRSIESINDEVLEGVLKIVKKG